MGTPCTIESKPKKGVVFVFALCFVVVNIGPRTLSIRAKELIRAKGNNSVRKAFDDWNKLQ